MAGRHALIVASDEFEHPGLKRLRAPAADARALARVLGDREVGGFEVRTVLNEPSHVVQAWVEDLFADSQPDDLVLLHFSGHGIKNDSGELFFATPNTRPDRLASTAVSADFVQRCIRSARARSIVLFLDCCYGGAFGQGVTVRASGPANVLESFPAGKLGGGRGRAVITASSAMEYAFEGTTLADAHQDQPSIFTAALVEGLSSGDADRDEDGLISLNELYDYVFDRVREETPHQTPGRDVELQGELYLAKSRRKRVRPLPLPPDVEAALHDTNMYARLGAVSELATRLASEDLGIALGAHAALTHVALSDIRVVSQGAVHALALASPTPEPSALDFGEVVAGSEAPVLEVAVRGLPIASAASVTTDAEWIVLDPQPRGVRASVVTDDEGEYAGVLTVTSSAGDAVEVPVIARVVRAAVALAAPAPVLAPALPADPAPEPPPPGPSLPESSPPEPRPAPQPAARPSSLLGAALSPSDAEERTPPPRADVVAIASVHDGGKQQLLSWVGGAALGAGLVVALSAALHHAGDTATWVLLPDFLPALLGVAIVGALGGELTLLLRSTPHVGPGLLAGLATPALLNVVGLVGNPSFSLASMQEGWYLGVGGNLALCAAGIAALVWFRKEEALQSRTTSQPTYRTVRAGAVLGSVSLLVTGALAIVGDEKELGSGLVIYGVATLAVIHALLRIRSEAGRQWSLHGWAFGSAGPLITLWILLDDAGERTWGVPIAIGSLFVVAAAPHFARRRDRAGA